MGENGRERNGWEWRSAALSLPSAIGVVGRRGGRVVERWGDEARCQGTRGADRHAPQSTQPTAPIVMEYRPTSHILQFKRVQISEF